jgi:hypothetical protein
MILDKNKLLNTGYLTFNLKDIDESLYNDSKDFFKKETLLSWIDSYRFDSGMFNPYGYDDNQYLEFVKSNLHNVRCTIEGHNSVDQRVNVQLKIYGTYTQIRENIPFLMEHKRNTFQHWYWGEGKLVSRPESIELLTNIYNKIPATIYDDDIINRELFFREIVHGTTVTLYTKDDFIVNHSDGDDTKRLCVFLMYLNDDYQPGYGGEIKVNGNIIEPKFGNIVILDFTQNNPLHEVLKVENEDFYRYALIKFFYK